MTPFAFDTLKNFPGPTRSLLVASLVVGLAFVIREVYILPHLATLIYNRSDLTVFTLTERGNKPRHPEILIAGSSKNGTGFTREILERSLNHPVSKIACPGGSPWECFEIIKRYAFECRHVRMIILDVDPSRLVHTYTDFRNERFLFFGNPEATRIPATTPQPNWGDRVVPMRIPLRQMRKLRHRPENKTFEKGWDEETDVVNSPESYAFLRNQENAVRQERGLSSEQRIPADWEPLDNEMLQVALDLAEYCRERNIHLVLNVCPTWYGHETILPESNPDPINQKYWAFIRKMESLPHCSFIACGNLEEIAPDCAYEKCFFDSVHMTRTGAAIHTNWLAEQLRQKPEVLAALETPRKDKVSRESLFEVVEKELHTAFTAYRSSWKSPSTPSATVQVASPSQELRR